MLAEQEKLTQELHRRELYLAEAQKLSHTGSFGWKPAIDEHYWSTETYRIWEYDDSTTITMQLVVQRVHPDDRPAMQQNMTRIVEGQEDYLDFEYRLLLPNASVKFVHIIARVIRGDSGEIEVIGAVTDITDRKRTEERAQYQKEAIKQALNTFLEELDIDRFLGTVITGLTKLLQAAYAEFWLFDESNGTSSLYLAAHQDKLVNHRSNRTGGLQPEPPLVTWQPSNVGRVSQVLEIPRQESMLRAPHRELLNKEGVRTVMMLPLVLGEQSLGFFELRFQVPTHFTSDDLDLTQALVNHATLALQLNRLAGRTERMAVTEERNRLAREIHDTLAQSFAGIVLHSKALSSSLGVSKLRTKHALLRIQKLARSGLEEARRSVRALRPKALDGTTLTEALEQELKRLSGEAELSSQFKQRGKLTKLSAEIQNELFRIAQEALTNVIKHARARSILITLEFKARQVSLSIKDDGIGLSADERPDGHYSFGLATMSERAQRIGGRLRVESAPTYGTTIRVDVPIPVNRLK